MNSITLDIAEQELEQKVEKRLQEMNTLVDKIYDKVDDIRHYHDHDIVVIGKKLYWVEGDFIETDRDIIWEFLISHFQSHSKRVEFIKSL